MKMSTFLDKFKLSTEFYKNVEFDLYEHYPERPRTVVAVVQHAFVLAQLQIDMRNRRDARMEAEMSLRVSERPLEADLIDQAEKSSSDGLIRTGKSYAAATCDMSEQMQLTEEAEKVF